MFQQVGVQSKSKSLADRMRQLDERHSWSKAWPKFRSTVESYLWTQLVDKAGNRIGPQEQKALRHFVPDTAFVTADRAVTRGLVRHMQYVVDAFKDRRDLEPGDLIRDQLLFGVQALREKALAKQLKQGPVQPLAPPSTSINKVEVEQLPEELERILNSESATVPIEEANTAIDKMRVGGEVSAYDADLAKWMLFLFQADRSTGRTLIASKLSHGEILARAIRGELVLGAEHAKVVLNPLTMSRFARKAVFVPFDGLRTAYLGVTPRKTADGIELTVSYGDLLPKQHSDVPKGLGGLVLYRLTEPLRGVQETVGTMTDAFMQSDIRPFTKRLLPGDTYASVKLDAAEYYAAEIARINEDHSKTFAGWIQRKLSEAAEFLAHYTALAINLSTMVNFVNEQFEIDIGKSVGDVLGEVVVSPLRAFPGASATGQQVPARAARGPFRHHVRIS